MKLRSLPLDELTIDDERSFRHVALYADLKEVLRRSGYRFRVPEGGASWDRVVFLNLTFWSAAEQGDLLADDRIPADVVAHVAWHHLAGGALGATADALLLAEAIASAFDLYLVGRLLGHAPESDFLQTQVPAMAEVAEAAGLDEAGFEALLQDVSRDPERAFEDLRALLFDATTRLARCDGLERAAAILEGFADHRFAPLLHHYELSNWILAARGHGLDPDAAARDVDAALRSAPVGLDWLEARWVRPALAASPRA